MEELHCKNCGSKNFGEINGIAACLSCGTKYPEIELKNIGIHEEFKAKTVRRIEERKEQEIEGLLNPQKQYDSHMTINGNEYNYDGWGHIIVEPRPGILSDDEVLRYAPKSKAAKKIRKKRKKGFLSRLFGN